MKSVTQETIDLALKIADSCARSDVECNTAPVGDPSDRFRKWDLDSLEDGDRAGVMESVRYLEMRGLIQRDPERPQIVSFPEASA
jgi:hypothetical protein